MTAIAGDNSIFIQLLTQPIHLVNKQWMENGDNDMLQFTVLSNPFFYISCVIIATTVISVLSYFVGKHMKQQQQLRDSSSIKEKIGKSSPPLCKGQLVQSTDNNGNIPVNSFSSSSSPSSSSSVRRVNTSLSSSQSIICPSTTDATKNISSTKGDSQSTDSTFIMSPSSTDLRPFLLIINGFLFGIFGVGIPIVYVCTQSGYDMFSCHATPDVDDVKTKAVKHLGMVYLIIMLSDFFYPLSCLLRLPSVAAVDESRTATTPRVNGTSRNYWSINMQLLHVSIWSLLQLVEIVVYPAGFSIFVGFMTMIHRTYFYGYLVMSVASSQVSPKSLRSNWRSGLLWTQLASNAAICLHHVYFSCFTPHTCGSKNVLNSTAIYCAITSIIMARNLFTNQSKS